MHGAIMETNITPMSPAVVCVRLAYSVLVLAPCLPLCGEVGTIRTASVVPQNI